MLDLINTPPHKIVFLGPGCSIATKPIAEAASYWQAVQVSVRNKSNKIISEKKMKNKKQIKQTIKTMKQVSCRKKKTTTTTTTKTIKTQQRGVRLFFSHFTGERASAGGSTQFFFLSMVKLQISSPMSEDRHVSDNLIRTSPGRRRLKVSRGQFAWFRLSLPDTFFETWDVITFLFVFRLGTALLHHRYQIERSIPFISEQVLQK